VSRTEVIRLAGVGLAAWSAFNAVSAYGNYAAAQALPEPMDWLAIAGPAIGAAAAFFWPQSKSAASPDVQKRLDAVATLMSSNVGSELKALVDAVKSKGFPPQGSLNVTFPDGTTQAVEWSVKKRPAKPV